MGDVTTGWIACGECGENSVIDLSEKTTLMATMGAFWEAHRECGRIYVDLRSAVVTADGTQLR